MPTSRSDHRSLNAIAPLALVVWLIAATIYADPPNVLDLPALLQQQAIDQMRGVQMLRSGQYGSAKLLFRKNVQRMPHDMVSLYNLACAHALLGQSDEALEMLEASVKSGFREKQQIENDEDLKSIREAPKYKEILKLCDEPLKDPPAWKYQAVIAPSVNGAIKVDSQNMLWNGKVMQVFVAASGSGKDRLVAGTTGALGDKIMQWETEGTAAGNVGDLYDNHDRLHSGLALAKFPQLSPIRFGPEVQKRQFDNGPQRLFLYFDAQPKAAVEVAEAEPASDDKQARPNEDYESQPLDANAIDAKRCIVIGNSSTAVTGPVFWRSMPRLILSSAGGAELATQHYTHNHLYVYPEHQDYDPGMADGVGWGDTYFANTPFFLISQGSSGTDQPFLEALAATLGAFQPETKEKLKNAGFMSPALQMLFRRSNKNVKSDDDYLKPIAHPTVFEGSTIDAARMVELAHEMKPDDVPPVVMLQVIKEKLGTPGVDYFDEVPCEVLLNTPFAQARMIHTKSYWHEMVVAAGGTDLNQRPLQYHWVILRGDPERIKLETILSNPNARRLRIAYHERRPIEKDSKMESNRVDIAVFAHNGVYYSAPAIISINFPGNEVRIYDEQGRIKSVEYSSDTKRYVDPAVVVSRSWRDEYHYDEQGQPSGWTRIRGTEQQEFNARGQLIETPAKDGQPAKVKAVKYLRKNYPDGRPYIAQE